LSGVARSSATASAPGPGETSVVRASSRPSSSRATPTAAPRGSCDTTWTRTGTMRPACASVGASTSVTARSGTCVAPVRSVCTGMPSRRAASTGSLPTLLAPSLTTTTAAAASAWGESATPPSASPRPVSAGLPIWTESPASRSANGIVTTRPRPRHAAATARAARSATTARDSPLGVTGSDMLSDRSTSTISAAPPDTRRSSTGWASSSTSRASATPRSTGSSRRATAGSGGIANR